ncbi:MAG: HAMP domain-containing sensor histidine kinase [Paracoccaceae bacterium]
MQKWRPPLALVIGGTLAALLSVPLVGIGYFRLEGNILGWGETTWLLGWIVFAATSVLAFLLWRLVLRPIWSLTHYARARLHGEDAIPPTHFGTPELHALGTAVTEMSAALQARANSLRAYADHVTHELKSPLTSLRGSAEMLQTTDDANTRATLIDNINRASLRMEQLLEHLQAHAKASQSAGQGTCQLSDVAKNLNKCVVEIDGQIPLAEQDISTVLQHLHQNALAHGATSLSLTVEPGVLLVADNGTGIAAGDRDRVFDPFFTTRRDTGGTGMGLNIVQTLLQARGARIALKDVPAGTCFQITFPA